MVFLFLALGENLLQQVMFESRSQVYIVKVNSLKVDFHLDCDGMFYCSKIVFRKIKY